MMLQEIILLIEKPITDKKLFAKVILLSQDIREQSYDKETDSYTKTDADAVIEAISKYNFNMDYVDLIYDLNLTYWNDIRYWAKKQLKIEN